MALEINKIHCGDCLELMPQIEDKSIDMILCDLPYGTTNCKWDSIIPFDKLWKEYKRIIKHKGAIILTASQPFTSALIMSNLNSYRHIWHWKKSRPTGFQRVSHEPLRATEDILVFYEPIITPQDYEKVITTEEMIFFKDKLREIVKNTGITLKELNVICGFEASGYLRKSSSWKNIVPDENKLKILCDNLKYPYNDLLFYLHNAISSLKTLSKTNTYNPRRVFNPQGIVPCVKTNKRGSSGNNWTDLESNSYDVEYENYPINILEIASEGKPLHPTQKPVELFEYLIKTYTNEQMVVLDNCIGVGTTAIACKNTNRNFIGIEQEQKYVDIANERLNGTEFKPNSFEKTEERGLFLF